MGIHNDGGLLFIESVSVDEDAAACHLIHGVGIAEVDRVGFHQPDVPVDRACPKIGAFSVADRNGVHMINVAA